MTDIVLFLAPIIYACMAGYYVGKAVWYKPPKNRGSDSAVTSIKTRFLEEGEECPNCKVVTELPSVVNCSCHLTAPCAACVNTVPACPRCGATEVDTTNP